MYEVREREGAKSVIRPEYTGVSIEAVTRSMRATGTRIRKRKQSRERQRNGDQVSEGGEDPLQDVDLHKQTWRPKRAPAMCSCRTQGETRDRHERQRA